MLESWHKALEEHKYPVDLTKYRNAKQFPGFFERKIIGDRQSTIGFEKHFRDTASTRIEPYLEVTYWKHSFRGPDKQTDTRFRKITKKGATAGELWQAVQQFVSDQTADNLQKIWDVFGYYDNVLATPLTFPAFVSLETLPMIDIQVAKWVNGHLGQYDSNRICKLSPFNLNPLFPLKATGDNFHSYMNWVKWCREVSSVLTKLSTIPWGARDVEMAVYTAERSEGKVVLEPLPRLQD